MAPIPLWPSRRKTLAGRPFESVVEAVDWIMSDRWVFFQHKPTHPRVAANWSLAQIAGSVRHGALRQCLGAEDKKPYTTPPKETEADG
jgi:hypothetical protein